MNNYPNCIWQPTGGPGIVAIACGMEHSLALQDNGVVWAAGSNSDGQLGDPMIREAHGWVVTKGNVKAIAFGLEYSFVITNDGNVWATGENFIGQFGDGSASPSRIWKRTYDKGDAKAIACGFGFKFTER
jgi:alpha-tubulin suppressor-like RCC1 family protein